MVFWRLKWRYLIPLSHKVSGRYWKHDNRQSKESFPKWQHFLARNYLITLIIKGQWSFFTSYFLDFFFLTFYFVLGYSRLAMLEQFQVRGTQPYLYMYPFSSKLPSHLGCSATLNSFMCYTLGPCWLSTQQCAQVHPSLPTPNIDVFVFNRR